MTNFEEKTDEELIQEYHAAVRYKDLVENSDSFGMAGEISAAYESVRVLKEALRKRGYE